MATSSTTHDMPSWIRDRLSTWEINPLIARLLVFGVVFFCGASFNGHNADEFVVHWQIYFRLAIAGLCGLIGLFWLFPMTYRDFLTWPGGLITLYCIWNGCSVPFSVEPMYSLAAWCSLVGVVLFVPGAMRVLGGVSLIKAFAFSTLCYVIGSWVAYLYFPEVGVWQEKITQTIVVERMGGLGHPNELGFYSAYTMIAFTGLAVARKVDWRFAWMCAVLSAVTMLVCFSRTAIIACLPAMGLTLLPALRERTLFLTVTLFTLLATLVLFAAIGSGRMDWAVEEALLSVTKSGAKDELTTATGRTEIWAFAIEKIAESPVMGYGYASARFVMEEYSFHSHNLVLNAAVFSGIPGGGIAAAALIYFLLSLFLRPEPLVDGLAIMLLIGGLVEELIGSPSPTAPLFIFVMLLFWRQLEMGPAAKAGERPVAEGPLPA